MDPCQALIAKLKDHPELAFEDFPGGVRVAPPTPTGFAVELRDNSDGWTVFLGEAGFHEEFTTPDEVLNFVAWCYSGTARVREVWRGGTPQKSILEACENGEWHSVSETGFLLVPWWRRRREIVLRNPDLLRP
jgi:hypothetical protein